jgi:8-oxo-dGTP pyrophosphatase MutT (NUDIX family)
VSPDDAALPPGITHLSACVIIPRADHIAAILSEKHGGAPELPGGKLDAGESAEDAARREVREEMGVEVSDLVSLMVMDVAIPSRAQVHRCTVFAGTIAPDAVLRGSAEGAVAWVTVDDLLERGTYRDTVAGPLLAYTRHALRVRDAQHAVLAGAARAYVESVDEHASAYDLLSAERERRDLDALIAAAPGSDVHVGVVQRYVRAQVAYRRALDACRGVNRGSCLYATTEEARLKTLAALSDAQREFSAAVQVAAAR